MVTLAQFGEVRIVGLNRSRGCLLAQFLCSATAVMMVARGYYRPNRCLYRS